MGIPQEIIESRRLTVSRDTDPELLFLVESYNEKMRTARRQVRSLKRVERIFLSLNIAVLIILGAMPGGIFILSPRVVWLEWTALGLFTAAFFYFGIWKRSFIVLTMFSALLLLIDARFALMLTVNAVLTVVHVTKLRRLKEREGYPSFAAIYVERKESE